MKPLRRTSPSKKDSRPSLHHYIRKTRKPHLFRPESIQPAALRNVLQQAPTAHNVFVRPTPMSSSTPPKQRLLKLNEIDYLLNPTAKDSTSAGGRQPDSDGTDSLSTAPIAATSRPATPLLPPTSMKKTSLGREYSAICCTRFDESSAITVYDT